jgi:hypothetical protein
MQPDVVEIPLTQGQIALIDAEDYDKVKGCKWRAVKARKTFYARADMVHDGHVVTIYMHRLLTNAPIDLHVDHINFSGTDNRKTNLRLCTNAQNHQHQMKPHRGINPYKGISWHKSSELWRAYIVVNRKQYHLGYFTTPEEAAIAYNQAAKRYFGEFAVLNEIPDTHALDNATTGGTDIDKSNRSDFTQGGSDARYTDFSEQDSTAGCGDHAVSLR